jgi:hypothetical protein
MNNELLTLEKTRFNALSQDEAKRIAALADRASPAMRSCWYCNPAHEHLKKWDFFVCFSCGVQYASGYPTMIVGMRMRGEEVTDEAMAHLAQALDEAI